MMTVTLVIMVTILTELMKTKTIMGELMLTAMRRRRAILHMTSIRDLVTNHPRSLG